MSVFDRPRRFAIVFTLGIAFASGPLLLPTARASDQTPVSPGAASSDSGAAPVSAPPPVSSAASETVGVDNPYGLDSLWRQGDSVARGTLLALVIMSIGTWYILITKLIEQSRLLRAARAAKKSFWSGGTVSNGIKTLSASSPFRFIAEAGVASSEHHEGELLEQVDRHTWISLSIQRAVDEIQSRLQSGLAFIGTVGSTAPFVGLFGTVWGIYHALTAIGIAGQASIDKVAGPVGEALIMTAFGLAVAVPAVLSYNWLVRRNKSAMEKVRNFGSDLHSVLLSRSRANHIGNADPAKAGLARIA
jgi:biopolymer transport protein ExbB